MEPKSIGIIGGAGPFAGLALLEKIFSLSTTLYGCCKDRDFPKVILLSFPFSEMLASDIDTMQLKRELKECISQLRNNGAPILAIACNTLHLFLDDEEDLSDLVHLPKVLREKIPENSTPLVLCTSTSRKSQLHKKFFPCSYPDLSTQILVDRLIDNVLRGADRSFLLRDLEKIIEEQEAQTIVLGCTELSLFTSQLACYSKFILDPLEIAARIIVEKSFS